jgi:hypothetical protein
MKLFACLLIAAAALATASSEASAGRRIAGPYYISYPYPYWTHRWGPTYGSRFWPGCCSACCSGCCRR